MRPECARGWRAQPPRWPEPPATPYPPAGRPPHPGVEGTEAIVGGNVAERTRRRLLETPHGYMECREVGRGAPLILLHATPTSSAMYADLLPHLAAGFPGEGTGVRAFALSTMGYGASDRPPAPYTTVREFSQAVVWGMDALGVERADVFATHTGAVIGVELAATWPERVSALILEEINDYNNDEGRAFHEGRHFFREPRADGDHLLELWSDLAVLGPSPSLRLSGERYLDTLRVNALAPDGAYFHMGWRGAGPYTICRYPLWERLPLVSAPALIIHGTNSRIRPLHERVVEALPDARGVLVPSRAVFTPNENPALLARITLAFLREHGLASA